MQEIGASYEGALSICGLSPLISTILRSSGAFSGRGKWPPESRYLIILDERQTL